MMRATLPLLLVVLLTGCAQYEYDLTQPPELAQRIGSKSDVVVTRGPLEYRLLTYQNVLVMRVFNTTDDLIELAGDQSVVVDPRGQSHPLRRQAIAPHSFVKMLFPPPPPVVYRSGPTFGVGVGTVVGRRQLRRLYDPWDPYYGDP